MARIHPDGWRELKATGAAVREIETLERLAAGLPDDYHIYHGVHWTRIHDSLTVFGEIDFAVVAPSGDLLLIEQTPGFLEETAHGLVKRAGQGERRIVVQLLRGRDALLARLNTGFVDTHPKIDVLLYCPDYVTKAPGSAGIDAMRIVDATRRADLATIIMSLLPGDRPDPSLVAKVGRFLDNELRLVPDASTVIGQSRVLYTRLSGGLAHWARCIDCQPFRLRITGTAGSGKTQLALRVLDDAIAAGRRPLYVCYNRPLADHIAVVAPTACTVATYHQLCDRVYRAAGNTPDFSVPGAFQALETFMAEHQPGPEWRFDEITIDEGQDFQAIWLDNLLRLLSDQGRVWWLEDPMQNLYGRAPHTLPGWVTLHADINYRSPKDILAHINRLLDTNIEPGSPLSGGGVEILVYDNPAELMERTKTAITRGLGAGFRKDAMALVTFRGREHSSFTPLERLGPHALRAYTGAYDMFGAPVYTPGDLLIDSVYRFKGQSAPCIIFTEIDFDALDDASLRKLFVGMTRASMKLVLVMSARAKATLGGRIEP